MPVTIGWYMTRKMMNLPKAIFHNVPVDRLKQPHKRTKQKPVKQGVATAWPYQAGINDTAYHIMRHGMADNPEFVGISPVHDF